MMRTTCVLALITLLAGCVADHAASSRILVSNGVHTFDSATGLLTQHNCQKPDESVAASLPAGAMSRIVGEANRAGVFDENYEWNALSSGEEAVLERVCVGSWSPPYRLLIESGDRRVDDTWQACPPHPGDRRAVFLEGVAREALSKLETRGSESLSGYDCKYR